ncbi:glycosyltransferase [Candidatus Sumerlaeota bacterium]|nr:glycosyltransferase [Candidatus Sumerlaeota bacterium]
MSDAGMDILMITHKRPGYTRLALGRLLDSCDETMRVWVWQNGRDERTISVVESFASHPRFHTFEISTENLKLNVPTNWFWTRAQGRYVSKVDDDCLVPPNWGQTLREAHESSPELGVVSGWVYPEEDYFPELAEKKIRTLSGGQKVMQNCWVGGSGYVMKRSLIERYGPLRRKDSFTTYCIRLASKGLVNGWYFPFVYVEHMDDPRAPHTSLRSDSDLHENTPLTAIHRGTVNIGEWTASLRRNARYVQIAPVDPRYHSRWRRLLRRVFGPKDDRWP